MDHVPPQHQHDAGDDDRHRRGDALTATRAKRRWLTALCALAALAFAALGVWQLERLAWKRGLIARVEARLSTDPGPLPPPRAWPTWANKEAEYTRIEIYGRFDHDKETLVQALTERGAGFWVLTPLRTTAGAILINRGFVPPERKAPSSRIAGQIAGPVRVTGLLRLSEPGGGFLRGNDPAAGRWYSRDVEAIAKARALGPTAPFFIDADVRANSGGYPVGGLTVVRFRNAHLSYALTWFALMALAVAGLVLLRRSSTVAD